MPKKQIVIGDAEPVKNEELNDNDTNFHTEGFDMKFMEPENVEKDEKTTLTTFVMLNEEELTDLDVRYEITAEGNEENTEWVDAKEDHAVEYSTDDTFSEAGDFILTIHVKDDDELHEHSEYEITVE